MAIQPFTSNYKDNSTEAGFQFTFYCDLCKEGFKTSFIESKTYKKGSLIKKMGSLLSAATMMLGHGRGYRVGYGISRGTSTMGSAFTGMSPKWHQEHEKAFETAQNEAKQRFHRCPKCRKWVCPTDWNEQEGLCTDCAPRINIEVAAARAQKATTDIYSKAAQTQVFTGEIESKQTLCPSCGKPAGEGKFCSNCGETLAMLVCPTCGAENPAETRFCGNCGTQLA